MEQLKKDDRFAHITKDPRFHQLPSKERKVKIDKRFKSMFEEKKFKLKYTVDKRGRPINTSTNENLRKFYELSDSDSEDSIESEEEEVVEKKVEGKKKTFVDNENKKKTGRGRTNVEITINSPLAEEKQGQKLKKNNRTSLEGRPKPEECKVENKTCRSKKKAEETKSGQETDDLSQKSKKEVQKKVQELVYDSENEEGGSEEG
jgi:hypothetical protein